MRETAGFLAGMVLLVGVAGPGCTTGSLTQQGWDVDAVAPIEPSAFDDFQPGASVQVLRSQAWADTYVTSAAAGSAFGDAKQLIADNNPVHRTLLRFQVMGLPAGASIVSATLRLFVVQEADEAGSVHAVEGAWTEAVTFDNAPALGPQLSTLEGRAALSTWRSADLTEVVTGNGTYDLYVVSSSANGAQFASTEAAANRPELIVQYRPSGNCTRTTCLAQEKNCGSIDDGCGGTLPCGTCTGQVCFDNRCCTPKTCATPGVGCGQVSNGCGGMLNCGCPTGQSCVAGLCQTGNCTPTTCTAQNVRCGSLANGCGATLNCGSCAQGQSCVAGQCQTTSGAPAPPPNFKVAFIGDTDSGSGFRSVLGLVKSEGAQLLMIQGDMDYSGNPSAWWQALNAEVGANFPVFLSVGNHDDQDWASYANTYKARLANQGINTLDNADLTDEMYTLTYQGLYIVSVGQNGNNTGFANFIKTKLTGNNHLWKICAWHKNQNAMQVGGKGDEMGWGVYENCRLGGAIIATGHEHSYSRTKTLTSMSNQTVDSSCSSPSQLCVAPGKTFAFVSGLGGNGVRDQNRCLPADPPYGCNGEWASIYASNQGARPGAMFITFHVNGDPKRASGYFKDVSGKTVDQFTIQLP